MMGLGRCARSGVEDALNVHRFLAIFPVLFIHEEDRMVHRGAIVTTDNDDSCSRIATMAAFLLQATRSEISKIQSVAARHRYYRVVAARPFHTAVDYSYPQARNLPNLLEGEDFMQWRVSNATTIMR